MRRFRDSSIQFLEGPVLPRLMKLESQIVNNEKPSELLDNEEDDNDEIRSDDKGKSSLGDG